MRYFRLPPEEWDRLDDLLLPLGKTAPPPHTSSAYVVEDDEGKIIFAAFLMLQFHFEQAIDDSDLGVSVAELHKVMEDSLLKQLPPGESLTYYSFVTASAEALAAAAEFGMEPIGGVVPHIKTITK